MNERRKDDVSIAILKTDVGHIKESVEKIEVAIAGKNGKNGLVVQTNSNKWRINGAYVWLVGLTTCLYLFFKEIFK